MRFLIDRCAGHRLAVWLRNRGHDCIEAGDLGAKDPGDQALLAWALAQGRILVTIDTDFGALVYRDDAPHAGLVRLPDVPATERIAIMADLTARHAEDMESGAIVTVRGARVRVSRSD